MQMRSRLLVLVVMMLAFPVFVAAEDAAMVVYAEGDGFTILRRSGDAERRTWEDPDFIGVGLADGDTILTDDGTFLELRMHANDSLVRVSENTSFEISQGGASGGDTRLAVTYGRVRAIVQRIRGSREFEIRGQTVVAGVRGTDFGVSVLLTPIGEIEDKVFVVEGEVTVQLGAAGPSSDNEDADEQMETSDREGTASATEAVVVSSGYQVAVGSSRDPIVVEPIDPPTEATIERTSFRSPLQTEPVPPPAPPPEPRPEPPAPAPEITPQPPEASPGGPNRTGAEAVQTTGARRSVGFRVQSGGGFVAAGGPDVHLFDRFFRVGLIAGGTLTGVGLAPAAAATVAIEPRFGRLVSSLGVSAFATSALNGISFTTVSTAVGATVGIGLEFDRFIDSLVFDNTFYLNLYPNAGPPLVYVPALGLRL